MKYWKVLAILLAVFSLLLSACELPGASTPEPTQPDPQAVFTSAAQTAEALRLERIARTATPAVEELVATAAAPTPTLTIPPPTETITATAATPETAIAPPTDAPATGGEDKAEFVEDVTIPDGKKIGPEKTFTKTWRLRNIGKTTWTAGYALVFIDGALMGASPSVPLPSEVDPWEKVDISVEMIAPSSPGTYRGFWKLRNAEGQIFGVGPNADEAIWVEIVVDSTAALEETTTVVVEQTVTNVSLAVNNAEVYADCPHTFVFTALFTLNKATSITYSLEAGDNTGSLIKVPPPTTRNLDAGTHSMVYELSFSSAITGWARLHITDPEQVFSNQVNFTLTC